MVTVCMTTYNGERFIEKQLESIYRQTRQPDQVIICDDGSVDSTVPIIERFIKDRKLQKKWSLYKNAQNKGYPGNCYYCMGLAQGDFIFLSDQDDIWSHEKVQQMMEIMDNNPHIMVLSCKMGLIDDKDDEIHTLIRPNFSKETGTYDKVPLDKVLYKNEWSGMVLVYRNSWYQKYAKMLSTTDLPHDLAICILAAIEQGMYQLDSVLAWHRRHDSNTAEEEHRITRLMNKYRKLAEIENYILYLDTMLESTMIDQEWAYRVIKNKRNQMQNRLNLLKQGKGWSVIKHYIKHHDEVRFFTMLCDAGICFMKK